MPPPKKLDLIPIEFRQWLAETLQKRGFGDIVEVTDELNARLAEGGFEISLGKSSVGDFNKVLKNQRDAFAMAETLLADMDIEAEGNMHKVLMQMIATQAFQLMSTMSGSDKDFDPKGLAALSRMLKDLMQSAGIREKLREDERQRLARKTRETAATDVEKQSKQLGLTRDTVEGIKAAILGVEA